MASQGSSAKKCANYWGDCEVNALLNVWQENYEVLHRTKRKKHIYKTMQRSLKDLGVLRTADEITTKLGNLTQTYKKKKAESTSTSGSSPSSAWKWYNAINNIIGRNPCEDASREGDSETGVDVEVCKEVRRDEEMRRSASGPSRTSTPKRKRGVLAQSSSARRLSPVETPVEKSEKTSSEKFELAILSFMQNLDKRMEEDLALKRRMVACMENARFGQVYPSVPVKPNYSFNSTPFQRMPYPFFYGSQQSDPNLVPPQKPSPRSKRGKKLKK